MPDTEEINGVFRIPADALPKVVSIARHMGLKPSQVMRALVLHALADPPPWVADALKGAEQ